MDYPDPNYAPPPNYDVESGTNCSNAKPRQFWKGGVFCEDVTIRGPLTAASLEVVAEPVVVAGTTYTKTVILDALGNAYYVLAAPAPYPVPPFVA